MYLVWIVSIVAFVFFLICRKYESFVDNEWIHATINTRPSERDVRMSQRYAVSTDLDYLSMGCGGESRAKTSRVGGKSLVYCDGQEDATGLVFDVEKGFMGTISGDHLPGSLTGIPSYDWRTI